MFLDLNEINPKIIDIIKLINKFGGYAYIVGGFIRDYVLENDRTSSTLQQKDLDVEVYNLSFERLEKILMSTKYKIYPSKKFGVLAIPALNLDLSIPRIEEKTGVLHTNFDVKLVPFLDFKKAAQRRDFTVNTLMYDLQNDKLIDTFDGMNDIVNKKLRHVSNKFSEDPLRIMRAIRFSSTLGFELDYATLKICQKNTFNLQYISKKRMGEELDNFFLGDYIEIGMKYYQKILLKYFSLEELTSVEQNAKFSDQKSIWENIKEKILNLHSHRYLFNKNDFLILNYTLLYLDTGKISDYQPINDFTKYLDYSKRSVLIAENCLGTIFSSKKKKKLILDLLKDHQECFSNYTNKELIVLYMKYKDNIKLLLYTYLFDQLAKNYQKREKIVEKFRNYLDLFEYIKKLDQKYTGSYFLEQGVENMKIKEMKEKVLFEKLHIYKIKNKISAKKQET